KTEAFERSCRDRKRVEMLFAHLKRIFRLSRLRLRGPCGAQFEFTLAAIAQNLRRLAKLVVRPPPIAQVCFAKRAQSSVAGEDHPSLAGGWQATTEIRSRQVPRTCHRRLLQQNRPIADMCGAAADVCCGPKAQRRRQSPAAALKF